MPTPPVVDAEFVVHLFAPVDGPNARQAYQQILQIWGACRDQLGMTQPVAGLIGPEVPAPEALGRSAQDAVLALRENPASVRQAVLRRAQDVLNLSVALAQPAHDRPRPSPPGRLARIRPVSAPARRASWADYAAMWTRARPTGVDALLGECHLLLARMPPGKTGPVAASAELGEAIDSLLPYRETRPRDWWRWGITTTAGYALWDTGLAADTSAFREIVLIAPPDSDDELSSWAWSDRTPAMPPFARYLMYAANLRYEARLLDLWHEASSPGQDVDALIAELTAALHPDQLVSAGAALRGRLRSTQTRLELADADLARLGLAISVAQQNLAAQPGCDHAGDSAGLFAGDRALASFLTGQVASDRDYLKIEISRTGSALRAVADELKQARGSGGGQTDGQASSQAQPPQTSPEPEAGSAAAGRDIARRVFVVYGRDSALTQAFFDLLFAVGLEPLEWEKLVRPTGTTLPYLGQVVQNAPHLAQATLVLLSPDDIVELHPDLVKQNDHEYEQAKSGQARPNVLFELGLAFMAYPERTIIVEAGMMRPIADLAGLNVIKFDGSALAVKKVLDRLDQAGCPADTSGTGWLNPGRFADLATYSRGPATALTR